MNLADLFIAKKLAGGGGGGTGTDNYNDLSNKPQINSTALTGDKSASDLGLQSEIDSDNKISADYVDDTSASNKFVSAAEKLAWSGKQDAIDADHKIDADYVDDTTSDNKFVTASDKTAWNAKQNAIDSSHKLSSDLVDDTGHTNLFVTSTEKSTWTGKQDKIDSSHKLSSTLVSFDSSEAAALASGIDSTKVSQIATNQTNILYALEKVGKNVLHFESLKRTNVNYGRSIITNGVRFTINDDNTITVNRETASNEEAYIELCISGYDAFFADQYCDGEHYLSGCPSGGSDSTYRLYAAKSTYAKYDTGDGVLLTSTPITEISIVISVYNGYNAQNLVFKPMICTEETWNISHAYEPYGAPNYDLTRLESEDRAALAEVVDSGSKNLLTNKGQLSHGDVTFTWNNDGSVTISGTKTAGAECYVNVIDNVPYSNMGLKAGDTIVLSNNGTNAYISVIFWASGSGYTSSTVAVNEVTPVVLPTNKTNILIRLTVKSDVTSVSETIKPMICTKAAFGVSPKFVPYRPDYQALVDKTTEQTFGIFKYNNNYSITAVTRKCNGFAWFTLSATSTANIAANTNTIIGFVDADVQPAGASTDRVIFTARVNTDPPSSLHSHIRGGDGYIYINSPTAIPAGTSISITGSYKI